MAWVKEILYLAPDNFMEIIQGCFGKDAILIWEPTRPYFWKLDFELKDLCLFENLVEIRREQTTPSGVHGYTIYPKWSSKGRQNSIVKVLGSAIGYNVYDIYCNKSDPTARGKPINRVGVLIGIEKQQKRKPKKRKKEVEKRDATQLLLFTKK